MRVNDIQTPTLPDTEFYNFHILWDIEKAEQMACLCVNVYTQIYTYEFLRTPTYYKISISLG